MTKTFFFKSKGNKCTNHKKRNPRTRKSNWAVRSHPLVWSPGRTSAGRAGPQKTCFPVLQKQVTKSDVGFGSSSNLELPTLSPGVP